MTSTVSGISATTLLDLVTQVWTSYLDDAIVAAPGEDHTDTALTASVTITGAWNGHVMVQLGSAAAAEVGATMLDLPATELSVDDIADAVGEIVNMIGGNVKAVLPEPSALGLPHVVIAAEQVMLPGATVVCGVGTSWHGHHVAVTVWSESGRETTE